MPFPKWFNELGQAVRRHPGYHYSHQEAEEILAEAERRIQSAENSLRYYQNQAERQQDAFRKTMDLCYALQYPANPELLVKIADDIDCGGTDCETAWREYDTNASGCTKEETDECPFANACALREHAKAVCDQAWTLAFAPGAWNGLPPLVLNPAEARAVVGAWVSGQPTHACELMQPAFSRWESAKKGSV